MNVDQAETMPAGSAADGPAARAAAIAKAGGIDAALASSALPSIVTVPLVEAIVLGLLRQGVRKYLAIFGHGNTALAEVLRIYEAVGVTRTWQFRNEIAMAHAATQLSWQYGEVAAVVTSIGPGALQAFAGSLAAASNGVGVYHVYGDETTHGEGYNMQQVPKPEQGNFGRLTAVMGRSHVLHTPESLREALRRGAATVRHPYKAGPFYLLMPINTQPAMVTINLAALPQATGIPPVVAADPAVFAEAAARIGAHERIVIKVGGGGRKFASAIRALAERINGVVVLSPGSLGVMPDAHPLNMHVGGSKGSISGNHAMGEATLLIAIGTRAVCQSDCSGIGYPKAREVINLNGDIDDLTHYANTLTLAGDIGASLDRLLAALDDWTGRDDAGRLAWLAECARRKDEWAALRKERLAAVPPVDPMWQRRVMTQPQAVRTALDFADEIGATKLFDAGDVQANGFQIATDDRSFETFTETGASYMGYAASALMAAALVDDPALSNRLLRRWIVHDEPADPAGRGRASLARDPDHLRQPPHGRNLGPAACPVRSRIPHQRQRGGRLPAHGERLSWRAGALGRRDARRSAQGACRRPCPPWARGDPRPGLLRRRSRRWPGRLRGSGTSATG